METARCWQCSAVIESGTVCQECKDEVKVVNLRLAGDWLSTQSKIHRECATSCREGVEYIIKLKARLKALEEENQHSKDLLRRVYDADEPDPALWAEVADFLHLTPVTHEQR